MSHDGRVKLVSKAIGCREFFKGSECRIWGELASISHLAQSSEREFLDCSLGVSLRGGCDQGRMVFNRLEIASAATR